jgi:shikimate dehydrogenase
LRLLYLLGYPVAHSLSLVMQNATLQALELDYEYRLMPVQPVDLEKKVNELRALSVAGFNITIPHKVAILPLLDELDETASTVGAVNIVVNDEGHLKGYNTDCLASTKVLREAYGDLTGCRVVILGAGGAARAVAYGLAQYAKWIIVLARDEAKAESLARELRCQTGAEIRGGDIVEAGKILSFANILVNATPVGMSPNGCMSPVKAGALHPDLFVFDLVYNPERTRLLREAESAGARTIGGLIMLVYQGSESFRLWTGREAPEALMTRVARDALEGAAA